MLSVGGFLADLRARAIEIMEALERTNIPCIVHGSIARGDVSSKSDIDVFIPEIYPSFTIVNALRKSGLNVGRHILVQATPSLNAEAALNYEFAR